MEDADHLDEQLQQLLDCLPDAVIMVDTEFRVTLAGGSPLEAYGYDTSRILGRLLSETLPIDALEALMPKYRAALAGTASEFDYSSSVGGGRFHVRFAPVRDGAGEVTGALSVSTDVGAEEGRLFELDNVRHLASLGSAFFNRHQGWVIDPALMELWGLHEISDPADVIETVVVPDDREAVSAAWHQVTHAGGRSEIDYRIVHGRTGQIRHMHGTTEVVVGRDGAVLRAMTTQIDTTEMFRARASADRVRVDLARNRELVLRHLNDASALDTGTLEEALQTVADIAVEAIGDGCLIRVLDRDPSLVESHVAAHRDIVRLQSAAQWLRAMPRLTTELPTRVQRAISSNELISGRDHQINSGEPRWTEGGHYLIAPIRVGATSSARFLSRGRELNLNTATRTPTWLKFWPIVSAFESTRNEHASPPKPNPRTNVCSTDNCSPSWLICAT
jgi:PAS domain S-box-containing protein